MPTSVEITKWLGSSNSNLTQIASDYWQIPLCHTYACYVLHLRSYAGWLNYGAELFPYAPNVSVRLRAEFYRFILDLNKRLNGAYVAEENEKLVLIRNDFLSDINQETLERGIYYFHRTHEFVYFELLQEAQRLRIRLVMPG
jgi:hypothetical protein